MDKEEPQRAQQRKMPNPRWINPGTSTWWWATGWKEALQKRNGHPGGQVECVINTYLQQRQAVAYWAAWGRALTKGQGRWSFPSIQFHWGHTWNSRPISWLPSIRETWTHLKESSKAPEGEWGTAWSTSDKRRGWENREDKARLFSVVSSYRSRDNRKKIKHRRFHLNIRKNISAVSKTKYCNKLPSEVVTSPSVGRV